MDVILAPQCRAGRALLGWSQQRLAAAAQVSKPTVVSFERGAKVMPNNIGALRRAMEAAGIEFLERQGVCLRMVPKAATEQSM